MKSLIPILTETWKEQGQVNCVNARKLHQFLESKQQFGNWINNNIKHDDLVEHVDFIKFNNFIKSNSKARIEYHLTLDIAKHLSMMERTAKGKQVRRYFIECERELLQQSSLPAITAENKAEFPELTPYLLSLMRLERQGSPHALSLLNHLVPCKYQDASEKTQGFLHSTTNPFKESNQALECCLLAWWKEEGCQYRKVGMTDLFNLLRKRKDWPENGPRAANGFSRAIRKRNTSLKKQGLLITRDRNSQGRLLHFKKGGQP